MDATHFHLAFTHFPIVGTIIGTILLTVSLYPKKMILKRTALTIFVGVALISIPVYLTGEEAEETVEHMPGISEQLIEDHEEFAEFSIWLIGLLGVSSLVSLFFTYNTKPLTRIALLITLILGVASSLAMLQLGNSGGQIRHSEIRDSGLMDNADHEQDE